MCGIAGANGVGSVALTEGLLCELEHRGPDGKGISFGSYGVLGMCRLRIRSSPGESNPIAISGTDFTASYNGEVYGLYRRNGEVGSPPTGGIEEVKMILQGAEAGVSIDGMYALAMGNGRSSTFSLQRDRFGIKPLYWRRTAFGFAFASELAPLLRCAPLSKPKPEAVAQFLSFGRVLGNSTFFGEIETVPPGGMVIFKDGGFHRYPGPFPFSHEGFAVPLSDLQSVFASTFEKMLLSERPIGLAVSGGLDSSILAAELNALGVEDLLTVSIRTEGSLDGIESLEDLCLPNGPWRNWNHSCKTVRASMLPTAIDHAVRLLGQPIRMSSIFPYMTLAEEARRQGIVVLLTGEGADELFGGYSSYQWWIRARDESSGTLDQLEVFALPPRRRRLLKALLGPEVLEGCRCELRRHFDYLDGMDPRRALRYLEICLSLEPLLLRTDHALMSQAIEARVPFLHGQIPALAFGLPDKLLWNYRQTKIALREAYRGRLSQQIVSGTKRSFRCPLEDWLSGKLWGWVSRRLREGRLLLGNVGVRDEGMEKVLHGIRRKDSESAALAFSLLALISWLEWLD